MESLVTVEDVKDVWHSSNYSMAPSYVCKCLSSKGSLTSSEGVLQLQTTISHSLDFIIACNLKAIHKYEFELTLLGFRMSHPFSRPSCCSTKWLISSICDESIPDKSYYKWPLICFEEHVNERSQHDACGDKHIHCTCRFMFRKYCLAQFRFYLWLAAVVSEIWKTQLCHNAFLTIQADNMIATFHTSAHLPIL